MFKQFAVKLQKFGGSLSAMVMPNIGAFIAWGLLAALFIPTGWLPNEYLNELVGPTLKYLMPILIGYTGGYNVYGRRGGVAGALSTMGVVIGADITMLVGGMIMGPLGAVVIRQIDKLFEGKVKPGMEMLIDNFSMGITMALMMILGYVVVEPVFSAILTVLMAGVQWLVSHNLLPFTSIFVQPAQVLFLNNAINHGIMVPIGIEEAAQTGRSILFLVEANGGTWLGLLLAFSIFGKGNAKKSAPGASLIMFLGGIGEVAFPYALSKPVTVLGPMVGNIVALFLLQIFGGGTVAAVSPGSFLALVAMTPKGAFFANILAYVAATAVSFLVVAFFLRRDKSSDAENAELPKVTKNLEERFAETPVLNKQLKKIAFACDAGMGSSVMGVAILKEQLKKAQIEGIEINHTPINEIPSDADLVITNKTLEERAKKVTNNRVPILTLTNFMDQSEYIRIADTIKQAMPENQKKQIFPDKNIVLGASFKNKTEAINACADIFIKGGYTDEQYRKDMIARDEDVSVYMGNGVALPHGLSSSKDTILSSGICFIQVPEGVDFDGETAYLLIGIAGKGEEHVSILAQIAGLLVDEENIDRLRAAKTAQEVLDVLQIKED